MHGDDVASAGVEISTQVVSKATEIFMEMLKIAIERERNKSMSGKAEVLSGGEVTYQKLKQGGEVTMLPSFARSDYKHLVRRAKEMDIPVAAIREEGKENTLSVFFNVRDKEAINTIVQEIMRERMKQPEQSERMITIEKEQAEGFQNYCAEHDIPVNFLENADGVKCIFNSAYEKQIETAVENFRKINDELSQTALSVQKDDKGKIKILVSDKEAGKSLTMNFCTKAKLERVMQERLGFSKTKAIEAANALMPKLTDEQKKYYLSGSRQLEDMAFYEKNIRFDDDNILTENYDFVKMQFENESVPKLTITDHGGNFVVLSANTTDRDEAEKRIRAHLKISDTETVKAVMEKAERLGFVDEPKKVQFKEYLIERETQTAFTVRGGSVVLRLDLTDKDAAKKQLMDNFGMSSAKAERIIKKAAQQSVTQNLLRMAREKIKKSADTLRHKKLDRGSRK